MPEEHPWVRRYRTRPAEKERWMVNKIKSITIQQIQVFRDESLHWRTIRRKNNNSLDESNSFCTSADWPTAPFALYLVAENVGSHLTLTPVHRQLVADDRPDLLFIRLNNYATDDLNEGKINFKRFSPGDIICVTMLQRCLSSTINYINEVTFESNTKEKLFWEVRQFYPIDQQILRNVTTVVHEYEKTSGGYINCVAWGFKDMLRFKSNQETRHMEKGTIISTKISKPWIKPNCDIKGFEGNSQGCFSDIINGLISEFRIIPSIINVGEATQDGLKMIKRYKTAFVRCHDTAYVFLETILSLGAYGVQAIQNHKIDRKRYCTKIEHYNAYQPCLFIKFQLLLNSKNASLTKWDRQVRIRIRFGTQFVEGEVINAIKTRPTATVTARIIGRVSEKLLSELENGINQIEVEQIENFVPTKIINWNQKMKRGSNGDMLLRALYGGQPIEPYEPYSYRQIKWSWMSDHQKEYIYYISCHKTTAFVATSCFGCGMTTAMAGAALYMSRLSPGFNIVVVSSDSEAVSFLNMLKYLDHTEARKKTIRLVAEKHRDEMEMENITEFDFPAVLPEFFQNFIKQHDCEEKSFSEKLECDLQKMMHYCKEKQLMSADHFSSRKMKELFEFRDYLFEESDEKYKNGQYVDLYLSYKETTIIVATAQDLLEAFTSDWKNSTGFTQTVQIDQVPTLSQSTLCQLAVLFQNARFSLVGDFRKSPTQIDEEVPVLLKEATIGMAMEDLVDNFHVMNFNLVFRCNPIVTELLGTMFYKDQLTTPSCAPKFDWDLRMKRIIPSGGHQVAVINNLSKHEEHETSFINRDEIDMVKALAIRLLRIVEPHEIGILCFFESQRNELLDYASQTGVTVLMVDAEQKREFGYVIVLTTRAKNVGNCKVLNNERSIKTALSRSTESVYLLGKIPELQKTEHWSKVIKYCSDERAVCYSPKMFLNQRNGKEEIDLHWNELEGDNGNVNQQHSVSNVSHHHEFLDTLHHRYRRDVDMRKLSLMETEDEFW